MVDELDALQQQKTWNLVPSTTSMNVVGSRWVYKVKLKDDGNMESLKARLVAKGYNQLPGIDFTETYSPVVKLGTIRLILSIATLKSSSSSLIQDFINKLHAKFAMKDLGVLHYFLGIQVSTVSTGLFLQQTKYVVNILKCSGMHESKPIKTPLCTKTKPDPDSPLYPDPHAYRSLVGALPYLTLTRPYLSFSVNYVSQFMHAPIESHFGLVRRILRYVKGTINLGLHIQAYSSLDLYGFSDFDWAGCNITRRSTTGYCTYLGSNIISWCSKKQPTVSRSSYEAEYRALAQAAAEIMWLTFILRNLDVPLSQAPILFCDNMSSLFMTINPVFYARSKHIEVDYHYIMERVSLGLLVTKHIQTQS
ncbi:uncharacterized protein LOC116133313 [Pistacia vera]|uniref:uncharacterized protein LOC116133313 n=1 Tax=Pistacia vera TaxID=55513 RepID=UPI001262F30E|nr:uncharacterized protein LOC116133313 [Pistacia vera]